MTNRDHYVIRRGIEGRERLRVLARVMYPVTTAFLDRLELRDGTSCLDVGCGGGDVTVELARRVGPSGRVVGVDIDETTIAAARREVDGQGIRNIEFQAMDVRVVAPVEEFDVVYARFLLTHLDDPEGVIGLLSARLRPGGTMALEDIDFSGAFTWPESDAYRRFHDLYLNVVQRRGGDPNIGKRLPRMLADGGLQDVEINVAQPMAMRGEEKLLNPITMENIADSVERDGLARRAEIESVVRELYRFADDPTTVAGLPRIVQAWGTRPSPPRAG